MKSYYTISGLAEKIGVSRQHVVRLIKNGTIKKYTNSKKWRRNRIMFNPKQAAIAIAKIRGI